MSVTSLIAAFVVPLEEAGIEYAIAGSVASSAYGEPRMTMDIDMVAALRPDAMARLLVAYPEPRFYLPPPEVVREECRRTTGGHFNAIDTETGLKADFYVGREDPLQHFALRERRRVELGEFGAWIAPPEYVILRKLESWREGGSAKHVRDIRGMLAGTERIDRTLIDAMARERGLGDLWREAQ